MKSFLALNSLGENISITIFILNKIMKDRRTGTAYVITFLVLAGQVTINEYTYNIQVTIYVYVLEY